MPAILSKAPGKIILFGEHAVVYDRPAIAIPVFQVQAKASILADPLAPPGRVMIEAHEIGLRANLSSLPEDHPLTLAIRGTQETLGIPRLPAMRLAISSTIPVAAGLGSGAAVSVAVIRALSAFLGAPLEDEEVNRLAYKVEQRLHGTPSGIDNTVVTYARPVYFCRSTGFQPLKPGIPLTFVIGDTGVKSPTAEAVGDVRILWQAEPETTEAIFDQIGGLVDKARQSLETGPAGVLGPLMNENQTLLERIGVSSLDLDRLVKVARKSGALGAKLSGGGRGGNMIALVEEGNAETVAAGLRAAGAVRTTITHLHALEVQEDR